MRRRCQPRARVASSHRAAHGEVRAALARIAARLEGAAFTRLSAARAVPILHDRTVSPLDLAVWADLAGHTLARRSMPASARRALHACAGALETLAALIAHGGALTGADGAPLVVAVTHGTDGSLIPVPGRLLLTRRQAARLSRRVPREVLVPEEADAEAVPH